MARYSNQDLLDLTLRHMTQASSSSWRSDFEALFNLALEEADECVDELCPGWAPFDSEPATDASVRTFTAVDELTLYTDPFVGEITEDDVESNVVIPAFEIEHNSTGKSSKNLVLKAQQQFACWVPGEDYKVSARWGWESVPRSVTLVATRVAARTFMSMRSATNMVDMGDGMMAYEPKSDRFVVAKLGWAMGEGLL